MNNKEKRLNHLRRIRYTYQFQIQNLRIALQKINKDIEDLQNKNDRNQS